MSKKSNTGYVRVNFKVKHAAIFHILRGILCVLAIAYVVNTNHFSARLGLFGGASLWAYYLEFHLQLFIVSVCIMYFVVALVKDIRPTSNFYIALAVTAVAFYGVFAYTVPLWGVPFITLVIEMPLFYGLIAANLVVAYAVLATFHKIVNDRAQADTIM